MVKFPEGDRAQVLAKWRPIFSLQNLDQTWNNLKVRAEKGTRACPSAVHGKSRETFRLFSPNSSPGHRSSNVSSKSRNFSKGWIELVDKVCRSFTKGLVNLQKWQFSQGKLEVWNFKKSKSSQNKPFALWRMFLLPVLLWEKIFLGKKSNLFLTSFQTVKHFSLLLSVRAWLTG